MTGGSITRAVVADGVPTEVDFRNGRAMRYEWKKVGGALVPVEARSGDEVLTARFRAADDDWVLPTELGFERVFGPDWGPEAITLRNLRIERE